jgi:hypothetical protein
MASGQSKTALTLWLSAASLASALAPFSPGAAQPGAAQYESIDVFRQFTQHIRRQADSDKREFAETSQCMNWFYRRERQKSAPPPVQGIAWTGSEQSQGWTIRAQQDCDARYPGGLEAVRKEFQRTQTSLSVTLTFYEFALVGDGDDNGAYNSNELRDILRALELPPESAQGTLGHVRALTGRFDSMHHSQSLESLMAGMSKLYDRGYRFTAADKANLDRVME